MLVPRSLLIILPSGNLQIEKGETMSIVKMIGQYEFLDTIIIVINCFELNVTNGISIHKK